MHSIKRVIIVIAFRDFRDPEYFVPKMILEQGGIEVKTASNQKGLAIGAEGGEAEVDLLISDVNLDKFDGVMFVGGPGCLKNLDNVQSYRLIKEAVEKEKILSSICISPVILAKAGVLEGKKATVWSSDMDKSGIKILKEKGADFDNQPLVIDGKIITANGPLAAYRFGEAIRDALRALDT